MKTNILIIMLSLLFFSGYAQVKDLSSNQYYNSGDLEFGINMNLGRESAEEKYNYAEPIEYYNPDYSDVYTYFHLGATAGYYFLPGLSFEPELNLNFSSESSLATIIGNISYTFFNPVKKIYPYIKFGYGISNYNTNNFYHHDMTDLDMVRIINSGAGLKIKYSSALSMKLEINYRNIHTSGRTYNSGEVIINKNIISLSFGIAVLY